MDYKLYPIPLCDVNRPVYYMMKSYFAHKVGCMPTDNLEVEWESVKVEAGAGWLLSFPAVDFSQPYDVDTLRQEVIILHDRSVVRQHVDGQQYGAAWAWDDDDDAPEVKTEMESHEDHYYIDVDADTGRYCLEKQSDRFVCNNLRFRRCNAPQMMQAIDRLLPLVREAALKKGEWQERLQVTRSMLGERVNELHILHNGGLYDYHVLEQLLSESGLDGGRWHEPFRDYVAQLKEFAMYAASLGWNDYGSLESSDNYVEVPPYIKEAWDEERQRRKDMVLTVAPAPQRVSTAKSKAKDKARKENNRAIVKRIMWYVAGMLGLVGLIIMAKYWLTGTVTVSVGVITATIVQYVQRLKAGYEEDNKHPRWFMPALIISALTATSAALFPGRMMSEYVYAMSDGEITPWTFFAVVALCLSGVAVCAWVLRKGKEGSKYRIYTFMMIISIALLVGQCAGSMGHAKQVEGAKAERSDTAS